MGCCKYCICVQLKTTGLLLFKVIISSAFLCKQQTGFWTMAPADHFPHLHLNVFFFSMLIACEQIQDGAWGDVWQVPTSTKYQAHWTKTWPVMFSFTCTSCDKAGPGRPWMYFHSSSLLRGFTGRFFALNKLGIAVWFMKWIILVSDWVVKSLHLSK